MKFIHLSDLHLGKRVNEYSMIEDQKYILTKIIGIIDNENPDGVIIAGDIYDKAVPSAEAVQLSLYHFRSVNFRFLLLAEIMIHRNELRLHRKLWMRAVFICLLFMTEI